MGTRHWPEDADDEVERLEGIITTLRQRVAELEKERVDCGKLGLDLCEQFKQLTIQRDELALQVADLLAQPNVFMKAMTDVADRLKRAGASIPAPENKGTVESAMATGLSIALLLVEEAIASVKEKA